MSLDEFSKITATLAWPIIVLIALCMFYRPIRALLQRLSETLTFKSLKVKALGAEAELTAEYARTVLHELLDDITESTNNLSADDIKLSDMILAADGSKTLGQLIPDFSRDDPEGYHDRLRRLRDLKLVVPAERGPWKPDKQSGDDALWAARRKAAIE